MIELMNGITIAPLRMELLKAEAGETTVAHGFQQLMLRFTFRALHRDTHQPVTLEMEHFVLLGRRGDPYRGKPIHEIVRDVLIGAMCHEVDEVIRLNGVRVREVHQPSGADK